MPDLICHALHPNAPLIEPASVRREWMDQSAGRHAYRCLPLTIANSYGWVILCPFDLIVGWDGGAGTQSLTTHWSGEEAHGNFAVSNFGQGIVTFHPGYIFQTPPGMALLVGGPPNAPKHGIAPLTGVVETDWLPYPFTMNWKMTEPGIVRFQKGEPFCHLIPTRPTVFDDLVPQIRQLEPGSIMADQFREWSEDRGAFMARQAAGDPEARKQQWQRHYFSGRLPDGSQGPEAHQQKIRAATPVYLPPKGTP